MIVDAEDHTVSSYIINGGTWEPRLIHGMTSFIKKGDTILNLGSQTGMEAVYLGKLIGPTGKLYILEPYTPSYRMVVKNVYLNDLEGRTKVYKVGASDRQSAARLIA